VRRGAIEGGIVPFGDHCSGHLAPAFAAQLSLSTLIVRLFCLTLSEIEISASEATMSTLTVTAKGQVTLRKDVLEHLGVHPGEKITVSKLPDGRVEVKAARPTGKISDVFGILKTKRRGRPLSIEKMNEIIARGWAGKR
jgi:AbrB family looped-hinge helix DNA binding protein